MSCCRGDVAGVRYENEFSPRRIPLFVFVSLDPGQCELRSIIILRARSTAISHERRNAPAVLRRSVVADYHTSSWKKIRGALVEEQCVNSYTGNIIIVEDHEA